MTVFLYLLFPEKSEANPQYLIKFATVAPDGSTWIRHMKLLDKDLRSKSDNRLGFRIYAGGIAGDELDVLKKIRIGQLNCAAFSGVGFGRVLPLVRVLDLPFLTRSDEEIDRLQKALRPFFEKQFREKGFELLSWAEVGDVHLFSKKRIDRVEDLSKRKVWAWSNDPVAKATFNSMGINPIFLAITDVTTAINRGMVDTVYAPPLGAIALQWHCQMKFMMALPLSHSTGAVLLSSRFFSRLPEELKPMLKQGFDSAMARLTSELRTQTREIIELIKQKDFIVTPKPKGKELQRFFDLHKMVASDLSERFFPKSLLERVYNILDRPRTEASGYCDQ